MSTNKKINLSLFMMLALFFILINNVALSSPNGQKTSQSRLSIQMPDGFDNYVNSWQYSSQSSHKAIYIAIDGYTSSGWAAGMCYGGNSLSAAKTCALNSCNSDRALMGINAACTIYAENNQYVYYDSFDSGYGSDYDTIYVDTADDFGYGSDYDTIYVDTADDFGYGSDYDTIYTDTADDFGYDNSDYGVLYSTTGETAAAAEKATLSDNLDIYIPSINFEGYHLWLKLSYSHAIGDDYYWAMVDLGEGSVNTNNATLSSTDLQIFIASIFFSGIDAWLYLDFGYEENGVFYWKFNNIGAN